MRRLLTTAIALSLWTSAVLAANPESGSATFYGVVTQGVASAGYNPYSGDPYEDTSMVGFDVTAFFNTYRDNYNQTPDGAQNTYVYNSPIGPFFDVAVIGGAFVGGFSRYDFDDYGWYSQDLYYGAGHQITGFYLNYLWSGDNDDVGVTVDQKSGLGGWQISGGPEGITGTLLPGYTNEDGGGLIFNHDGYTFEVTSFQVDGNFLVHYVPTPEPFEWLLLLSGFAFTGFVLRRSGLERDRCAN